MLSVTVTVTLHVIERRRWSSSNSIFYIFAIQSIPWPSILTTEVEIVVGGAQNQFMVLATVVKNAKKKAGGTGIINHVRKYPLVCTIPCTQSILLFSLTRGDIQTTRNNFTNANSAKNIKMYTLIGVPAATSTFTSHALLYCPLWKLKLNCTTTH